MNNTSNPNSNLPNSNNSNTNLNKNNGNGNTMAGGRRTRKRNYNNENNVNMDGGAKIPAKGTKAQVWHGTARHTSGGLTKKDLMKTKKGRIVSRKKHAAGKKALKNLVKAGYKAKKGTFKLFKK